MCMLKHANLLLPKFHVQNAAALLDTLLDFAIIWQFVGVILLDHKMCMDHLS